MALLPATFTFTYNGVSFGTYSNFKASMEPVRDEAKRTVICLHFKIQASVTITTADNPTTDTTMVTLQRMLAEDGGRLTLTGVGLGNMDINAPGGTVWDVNWGPKCTVGNWTPIGSNIAAQADVTIDTWIPVRADAVYKSQPMAFNYEVEWNITDGLSTRTISGYLEIPLTRWNGQAARTVPEVADQYRDNLAFTVPLGFRRRPEVFRLSSDRKRLDFSFTDVELDSDISPPPGAVEIQTRQTVENERPLVTDANWIGTISTSARGTRGAKRSDIMAACVLDIQSRLKKIKTGQKPDGTGTVTGFLIRKWRFWEEWYAREFGIDIQYQFIGSLATIFDQCGFWTTVPSDNWPAWRTSMAKAWSVRGHADLAYNAGDDAIIDLCTRTEASIIANENMTNKLIGTLSIFTPDDPTPKESWLDYRVNLIHRRHESTVAHKLSQALPPTLIAGPKEWLLNDTTAAPIIGVQQGDDDVVQSLSTPSYHVSLVGTASRVKYRIPKPELLRVNGINANQFVKHGHEVFVESVVGNTPAGPIYKAIWSSEYRPLNAPAGPLASAPNHEEWVLSTIP